MAFVLHNDSLLSIHSTNNISSQLIYSHGINPVGSRGSGCHIKFGLKYMISTGKITLAGRYSPPTRGNMENMPKEHNDEGHTPTFSTSLMLLYIPPRLSANVFAMINHLRCDTAKDLPSNIFNTSCLQPYMHLNNPFSQCFTIPNVKEMTTLQLSISSNCTLCQVCFSTNTHK